MHDELLVEKRSGILELTLNRPSRRNALSRHLIARLADAFRDAVEDPDVRAVLLSGAPPAFCAGLDLHEVAAGPADTHDTSALFALFERIARCEKPIVAAVQGAAMAGGAGLLTVCDVVVAGATAQVGFPGVHRGLVATVLMPFLLRAVGQRRAKELMLTGRSLTAQEAWAFGLASEVVPDDAVMPRARQYAAELGGYHPAAVATIKTLLTRLGEMDPSVRARAASQLGAAMPLTPQAHAGLEAFLRS